MILAADVLEHVRTPEQILDQLKPLLAPGGSVIVSVPNFGHWYPRVRVAVGRFDYDRRGILDRDHVRFFTKPSFERLIRNCGYSVARRSATGLPLEVVDRGGQGDTASSGIARVVSRIDRATVALRPQLFAYQFVYELRDDLRHPRDDAGVAAVKNRRIQPSAAIRPGRTRVGK